MPARDNTGPVEQRLARALSASGAVSLSDPKFAKYLDQNDKVAVLRDQFNIPKKRTVWTEACRQERGADKVDDGEEDAVYLAGNSLGLMPKRTPELLSEELHVWSTRCVAAIGKAFATRASPSTDTPAERLVPRSGVLGHMDHDYQRPWVKIDEHVTPYLAEIVGEPEVDPEVS